MGELILVFVGIAIAIAGGVYLAKLMFFKKFGIIVKAEVPLPEMNDYSTFLSRISDTETRFHLEFVKYNRVSKDLVKQT